jgi:dTDP-4-dehydrorhamnose reductase
LSTWAQGTVVVLGAGGMLAHELIPRLQDRAGAAGGKVLAWDRDDLDITDRESVLDQIERARPSVVINCAAYTDVDGCESNVVKAMSVNAEGPAFISQACRASGALLVDYSTDFIFDGSSTRPYETTDVPNPLSVYGKSKFLGARAVCASKSRYLIVRTSWLYGSHGKNFVEVILAKANKGEGLKVVTDQVGRPTYTADLSDATLRLLDAGAIGITHFANSGQCSWHEFAMEIIRQAGLTAAVGTLSSAELGRPAKRPAYSVLDLSSFEKATGTTPRHWKDALSEYMQRREIGGKAA